MEHQRRLSDSLSTVRWTIATILLALVMLASSSVLAQTPVYLDAWSIGGTGNDRGLAIATAANGSVYSTGHFTGTVDFNRGAGTTNLTAGDTGDVYVTKYDSSGGFVWAFRVGGVGPAQATTGATNSGVSIAVDGAGNVVVMGYFAGTADFDPGLATTTRTARAGTCDMFVAKYNSAGGLLWVFSLPVGIELQYSKQHCLDIDSQNNIVVGGQFLGTIDFNPGPATNNLTTYWNPSNYGDAFVAKYNASGSYVWAIRLGSSPDWETVQALAIDRFDNIHVGGIFGFSSKAVVNFNPWKGTKYNVTPPGKGSNYVAKYNSAGQIRWAFGIGNDSSLRTIAMEVDDSSNVVITGYMQGTVDFNPLSTATAWVTPRNLSNMSIFMAKYDSVGKYRWAFATAMGAGSALAIEDNGDILVTGNFACTGDFDPSADSFFVSSVTYCRINGFLAKYSAAGSLGWVFGISGLDSGASYGKGLALDAVGNIYVTGQTLNTSDFDPSGDTNALTSAGGWDVFVAKYTQQALPKRTARPGGSRAISVHISPNPFANEFTLRHDGASVPAQIHVSDLMGRVVEVREVTAADEQIILGSELPTGTYIVEIIQGTERSNVLVHKVR